MNIVAFVIGFVLFIGGVVLFGYAWDGTHFLPLMFTAGLVAISAGIFIPFHLLKHVDG
ncbi:MAG: hypothetical protein JWL94_1298 [Microbacteriaceae bacterium]|jgi:hypothetical protein|nr:hypothetical protein [Microbacteriaceae bacterium]HEV7957792.1 hypothetical protein [Marisediminicola sp.]